MAQLFSLGIKIGLNLELADRFGKDFGGSERRRAEAVRVFVSESVSFNALGYCSRLIRRCEQMRRLSGSTKKKQEFGSV